MDIDLGDYLNNVQEGVGVEPLDFQPSLSQEQSVQRFLLISHLLF